MLIAIYLFLFSGDSFAMLDYIEEKEDLVVKVVMDDTRKKSSLGIIKTMTSRAKEFQKQRSASKKQAKKLIEKNAGVDAIDGVISTHFEQFNQYNSEMLDLRFELKEQITETEWLAIFIVK
jgi:K+/H+ antiporter YhaU regulatory subunit KhtT